MKNQLETLQHAAGESIQKCAFVKAQTVISQIEKITNSLKTAYDQKRAEYAAAKKGKKRAAAAAEKEAKAIYDFSLAILNNLKNTLSLAKAAAEKEAAEKKAAAAAKQEQKRNEKAAGKTAAKAVTAAAGRALNQYRNSYKGLLRDVANDIHVNGANSVYLKQVMCAIYGGLQTEKIKGEQNADFVFRAMKNGAAVTANINPTKTILFEYLSNVQKMFKLFCDTLPCVEIGKNENGKSSCTFAKVKTVAYCGEKASIQVKENTEKYSKVIISETLYYLDNDFLDIDFAKEISENGEKVLSRRRINADKQEQNRYYISNGNIVTLHPSERVNFTQLLPAIASVCTAGALKQYDEKQKAAAAKAVAKAKQEKAA